MSRKTEIDKILLAELIKIRNEKSFCDFIFNYCESQSDRKRLLDYILYVSNDRKNVLLMASQIGIESGTVDGELEDE